jgi:ADP-ribose pyrophosphatase YjhB (NUDIX family)
MKPNIIRTVAIGLFRNGNRILVSDGLDPETGRLYCRPLGGSVEFGELAAHALAREIREELGVEIREVQLLGVLENLFTLDGRQAHEVVFVFDARFEDESLYERETLPFHEEGWRYAFARWFDVSRADKDEANLVPEGLLRFLEEAT